MKIKISELIAKAKSQKELSLLLKENGYSYNTAVKAINKFNSLNYV